MDANLSIYFTPKSNRSRNAKKRMSMPIVVMRMKAICVHFSGDGGVHRHDTRDLDGYNRHHRRHHEFLHQVHDILRYDRCRAHDGCDVLLRDGRDAVLHDGRDTLLRDGRDALLRDGRDVLHLHGSQEHVEEEHGEGLGEVSWRGRSDLYEYLIGATVPVHGGGVPLCDHLDHHVDGVLRHDRVHGVHDSHEHKETDDDESFSGQNLSVEKS